MESILVGRIPNFHLKSLGPIDRKFHEHSKNDEFVLYEYIIKQSSSFFLQKYKHQRYEKHKISCQQ